MLKPPPGARYCLPDGRVLLVGNDGMSTLLNELNAVFEAQHPAVRFHGVYQGSSTGFPALISQATPFTAMAREVWPEPLEGFRATHARVPRSVRIGYSGHGPRAEGKTPPSVYVHQDNPLPGLDLESLVRMLTTEQPLNVYLPDGGLGFIGGFRSRFFPELEISSRCQVVGSREAVIRSVAEDPSGIGLTGWCAAWKISDRVRQLPLAERPDGPFRSSSIENVAAGRYPLSYHLTLYLWEDAAGIDPIAYAWAQLALSDQGQAVVAGQTDTEEGYVPLSAADLETQREIFRSWPHP